MALSADAKARAKDKAKAYLEFSIYTLAVLIGLDPEDLPDVYENPIVLNAENTNADLWYSHECLKLQIEAYTKLV